MSAESPHRKVTVTNGQNVIRILNDGYASCLVIRRARIVNWPDCHGSVGEYFAHSNYSDEDRQQLTQAIDQALRTGTEEEILTYMHDFLQLFESGEYTAGFYTIHLQGVEFHRSGIDYPFYLPENERFSGAFYPMAEQDYFYTLKYDRIDPERVDFYVREIQRGARPKVVVYSCCYPADGDCSPNYIIDGHHKLEAYLRLGIDVPCLSIFANVTEYHATAELLRLSYPFLKDFEFAHLFENADKNLLHIDFPNESLLTNELCKILHSTKIDTSIIDLLKKYAASEIPAEKTWYRKCIKYLGSNKNIGFLGDGVGVRVYRQEPHEKWGTVRVAHSVKNRAELRAWINETIGPANES